MMTFTEYTVLTLGALLIVFNNNCWAQLYEGSSCTMKSGVPGICTKLSACRSIDEALKKREFPFKNLVICSFDRQAEVICCPDNVVPSSSSDPDIIILNRGRNIVDSPESTTSIPNIVIRSTTVANEALSLLPNVEKVVSVGNIHITAQEEFVDLTELIKQPFTVPSSRSQQSIKPIFSLTESASSGITVISTTRRPSAKIRDLISSEPITRWPTTSTARAKTISTSRGSTFLFPVSDNDHIEVYPDVKKNEIDLSDSNQFSWGHRSDIYSQKEYSTKRTRQTPAAAMTTSRPKYYLVRPISNQEILGTVPKSQPKPYIDLWDVIVTTKSSATSQPPARHSVSSDSHDWVFQSYGNSEPKPIAWSSSTRKTTTQKMPLSSSVSTTFLLSHSKQPTLSSNAAFEQSINDILSRQTTRRPATTPLKLRPIPVRPSPDEVDLGAVPNQLVVSKTTPTVPPSFRSIDLKWVFPPSDSSESDTFIWPSTSARSTIARPTKSQPLVISDIPTQISSTTLLFPQPEQPAVNSSILLDPILGNTEASASTSVLDQWMLDILNGKSPSSSSTDISSLMIASTSQTVAGDSRSPEDNNVFITSSTQRDRTPVTPMSRVSERKADRVCIQYEKDYAPLPGNLDFHILEGEPAYLGEFPHMAALGYPGEKAGQSTVEFNCGASLISNRYVITAAHCVRRRDLVLPTVVRLGTINLAEVTSDIVDVGVENITVHPKYITSRQYHDVALIRLNRDLVFESKTVFPACLHTDRRDIDKDLKVVATGFGQTASGKLSDQLLKANLTTVELADCNRRHLEYARNVRIPDGLNDGQLCAYDVKQIQDTCPGDSGGPLQEILDSKLSKIWGITSFGIACGSAVPGVYARVAFYLDWIEQIVWPNTV